ncbi:MAG TPA: class I SAM-dependent RNA methyltransferase, partial [Blastocatellia bacterium]|nr:class I SAM-dependent RNA methyltransferase [Blastocatellia bacterium]
MKESGPSRGDIIEVTTERMAYGGDAVTHFEGLTVFIPLAAPEERLRVRITERKKRFARATILEIISPSPSRREPPCRYFGQCGGCQLQHLSYDAQLEAKAGFVRDALSRIARIDWPHEIPVRRAREFEYRARAQIKVERQSADRPGDLKIGFNRTGSHDVCDVAECPVLTPEMNAALSTLRSGLVLVSSEETPSKIEMAAGQTGVAVEPEIAGLRRREIERSARGATYRFDATTFFQVNPFLLEDLIDEATKGASGRLAIDLYAGVGLFTIQLARAFDRVIGVESGPEAARFARLNIEASSAANIDFYQLRVETWLNRYAAAVAKTGAERPDLVLLDPPRNGAIEAAGPIIALGPERVVYVACDPTTMARDLRVMIDSGYQIERIAALDLFPQTYHIETVVSLERSQKSEARSQKSE